MVHAYYQDAEFTLVFADPERKPEDPFGGQNNVFFCGPLMHPDLLTDLVGRLPPFTPAVARGYSRHWEDVEGEPVCFMVPADDEHRLLTGMAYLDVTKQDLDRIAGFELASGLRKRVEIQVLAGERRIQALTYLKR